MKQLFELEGTACEVLENGTGGPVFFFLTGHEEKGTAELEAFIREMVPDNTPWTVFMICTASWDRDLSPWEADLGNGRGFSGGGRRFLAFLEEKAVPWAMEHLTHNGHFYLAGYSLAGLFALWGLYESHLFSGSLVCSASLWFPGFVDWCREKSFDRDVMVYLSLGGKEPNTKDPLMATVLDCYKAAEKHLKRDPHVRQLVFEMNPGGHFANGNKRLAKGVRWMIEKENKVS